MYHRPVLCTTDLHCAPLCTRETYDEFGSVMDELGGVRDELGGVRAYKHGM